MEAKPKNIVTLKEVIQVAEDAGYAIGSFAPRYIPMIRPILRAAEATQSPVIVQISQKELDRYGIRPHEFSAEFYSGVNAENITVPVVLHLDHTKDFEVIQEAIESGFTSVMIDASEHPLERNIEISKHVSNYAHQHGVSVEAELGRIGTTDFIETDSDMELYTDPEEARYFVEQTKVDALAVSVGTAHGVYMVKEPKIDFNRLQNIRKLTPVHLVLHGGSGVPEDMIQKAIQLTNKGVSKVNIATDLEVALLNAIDRKERMTNAECAALSLEELRAGEQAVEQTVRNKIVRFLKSHNRAGAFGFDTERRATRVTKDQ